MSGKYDAAIIGGGPGGYMCAIRIAQLGGNVCLIEKNGLGGTCTQRGCIPTKYLHSVGYFLRKADQVKKNGLKVEIELEYKILKSKMQTTVSRLASGIKLLLKSNGVELIEGEGRIVSNKEVIVNDERMIKTENIVLATGGHPVCLPGLEFGENILSTTSILELNDLPKSITIIGAGYSGCEFASIFNALGSKVCLVEADDHLMPGQIEEIGNAVEKYMKLDGVDVRSRSRAEEVIGKTVVVNGEKIDSEKILVCIGRAPNINPFELKQIGVNFNEKGIVTDKKTRTSVDNVYAIGDVTGLYELAHVAAKQGEVAAENIMGMVQSEINYRYVPSCVFTYPEVAFVGELGGKSGEFPLTASAKANCLGDTRGIVKVFEREKKIIGCYIIGSHAGELIGEASLAIKMGLSPKDVFDTIHPHPTLPESFVEAMKDIYNESVHLPRKTQNHKATHG